MILLTCEHGGNQIPSRYKASFKNKKALLKTHRGLDIGALGVAKKMQRLLKVPLIYTEVSRLLVDCNRSVGNKTLFSTMTLALSEDERAAILDTYYFPHVTQVNWQAEQILKKKKCIHLGIHSFTPKLGSQVRNADIGLLYDPKSKFEAKIARRLYQSLRVSMPHLRIRMNYPYKGASDGIQRNLRRKFGSTKYAGIEIEMNQALFSSQISEKQRYLSLILTQAIRAAIRP